MTHLIQNGTLDQLRGHPFNENDVVGTYGFGTDFFPQLLHDMHFRLRLDGYSEVFLEFKDEGVAAEITLGELLQNYALFSDDLVFYLDQDRLPLSKLRLHQAYLALIGFELTRSNHCIVFQFTLT